MRRFSRIFLAAPLALALSHCAAEGGAAPSDDEPPAQSESLDAGSSAPDEGAESQRDASTSRRDGGSSDAGATTRDAGSRSDAGRVADAGAPALDGGATSFALTSTVVNDGERIDNAYRCNVDSPPLRWTAGPAQTKSYALVFKDQGNGFTHWVIYDIPATESGLPKGVPIGAAPAQPAGAKQVPNWSGRVGYGGPCGGTSTYVFTLYALDVASLPGIAAGATSAQVVRAIEEHDLGSTQLTIMSSR